jgi:ferredoxin-NADP reductase/predicted pyridoxine 5'-phosphate oxidase superfamily flavin-nucleotide-binding protein
MDKITNERDLETLVGKASEMILMKQLTELEDGCLKLLAHSPIAGFGYIDELGNGHSSMVGGFAGFTHVISSTKIKFDFDIKLNPPVKNGGVSMVFLLPGIGETLRLNGKANSVVENSITISIEEIYIHCARSILRSKLWQEPKILANFIHEDIGKIFYEPLKNKSIISFLKMSPFAVVSTWHQNGSSDTSPRGDEAGLLRIINENKLVMPDRKGNQRTDTFRNLLSNNQIALTVVLPGSNFMLQIQGTASISTDADLLTTMALSGKPPLAALIIDVKSAVIMENEAILQADIWNSKLHVDKTQIPDMMALASHHMSLSKSTGFMTKIGRFVGKLLAGSPKFMRFLINIGYDSQLKGEGYIIEKSTTEKENRSFKNSSKTTFPTRKTKVVKVINETADTFTLYLEDISGKIFDFKPGQFFTLIIYINGEKVMRSYSASNVPGSKLLTLTIKKVIDGKCSTYIHTNLKVGDEIELLGPSGHFCVSPDLTAKKEYVLLAGGSGITPMMSIAETVLIQEPDSTITLLYGNRKWEDAIFANKWLELCKTYPDRLQVQFFLTAPAADWQGKTGRLDKENTIKALQFLKPSANAQYFICGPAGMMTEAKDALLALNIKENRIFAEKFSSPSQRILSHNISVLPQTMTVIQGNNQLGKIEVPAGKTLLQAGIEADLAMPYSCGMGNCGECMVKLLSGEVHLAEPNCLSESDKNAGYILSCVAQPKTDVCLRIN